MKISKGEGIKAAMWTTLMGICSKVLDASGSRLIGVLRMVTNRWYRSLSKSWFGNKARDGRKEEGEKANGGGWPRPKTLIVSCNVGSNILVQERDGGTVGHW